ncbi:uncharacterized protein LOC111618225 [Centruroides sculpturatus]|uniref:uncharacterized protein LOC111618225 n=1 Tax=Centruroides sculpturatus TaxID=218467 RepID=UPI000C6E221D|nr:uncharacterized protein LOC111618225 [Centruroides sculpturatus]
MAALIRIATRDKTQLYKLLKLKYITRFLATNVNNEVKKEENSIKSDQPEDFFGLESDINTKSYENVATMPATEKYQYLFQKEKSPAAEKTLVTSFGEVRLDSDNIPKYHGQYHEVFDETLSSMFPEYSELPSRKNRRSSRRRRLDEETSEDPEYINLNSSEIIASSKDLSKRRENLFDNECKMEGRAERSGKKEVERNIQKVSTVNSNISLSNGDFSLTERSNIMDDNLDRSDSKVDSEITKDNFIDSQYFGNKIDNSDESLEEEDKNLKYVNEQEFNFENRKKSNIQNNEMTDDLNFIDEQYFNENRSDANNLLQGNFKNTSENTEYIKSTKNLGNNTKCQQGSVPQNLNDIKDAEFESFSDNRNKRKCEPANLENPRTAYDYVMKLRKDEKEKISANVFQDKDKFPEDKKTDSKGFRILKDQVKDLTKFPQETIVTILKDSIIYNDNDIVAISKPYGLSCQGEPGRNSNVNVKSCLPELAQKIMKKSADPTLYLVNTIGRDTTGVILLAKTKQMAQHLTTLLTENKIIRVYWVITRGIPELPEGVIDIPIAEGSINGRKRMVLKPEPVGELKDIVKPSKYAERAITHYNIIATVENAALMEVKPETSVKHQIRVHLGFGLRCPILGDHKYSHLDKLAPQRLPDSMLRRLGIQQSKARYVPMHLHLKNLVIPEILDGKNLFFKASLPPHFKANSRSLKFKKK